MQKSPLIFPLVCLIAGILSSRYQLNIAAGVSLILCSFIAFHLYTRHQTALLVFILTGIIAYCTGYLQHEKIEGERALEALLLNPANPIKIWGTMIEVPVPLPVDTGQLIRRSCIVELSGSRFLQPRTGNSNDARYINPSGPCLKAGTRLLTYISGPNIPIEPGECFSGLFFPDKIKSPAFPGEFSQKDYFSRLGVAGHGFLCRTERVDSPGWSNWRFQIFQMRKSLVEFTFRIYPERTARFLSAILYGCRDAIPEVLQKDFRTTGTGHILAISGLHVGLVTGMLWYGLRTLRINKRVSAILCILGCLLYLGISGGRPSAMRAGIMAMIYLGGTITFRPSQLMNALAAAAILLLFQHPPAITDAGFLLSFTAVLFLSRLCVENKNSKTESWNGKDHTPQEAQIWTGAGLTRLLKILMNRAWSLLLLSIAVWFGLWPLSAYYFNMLSVIGIFLNILVIPGLSFVLIGGLAGMAALGLPPSLQPLVAFPAGMPAQLMLDLIIEAGRLSRLSLYVGTPPFGPMALYYFSFCLLFLKTYWTKNPWLPPILVGMTTLLLINSMRPGPSPSTERITIIKAGVGEMAIVDNGRGDTILVGQLPSYSRTMESYLRGSGITQIEQMITFPVMRTGERESLDALLSTNLLSRTNKIILIPRYADHRNTPYEEENQMVAAPEWEDIKVNGVTIQQFRRRDTRLLAWRIIVGKLSVFIMERGNLEDLQESLAKHQHGAGDVLVMLNPISKVTATESIPSFRRDYTLVRGKTAFLLPFPADNRLDYGAIQVSQNVDIPQVKAYGEDGWFTLFQKPSRPESSGGEE